MQKIDRRQFLAGASLLGSAGALAPHVGASSLFRDEVVADGRSIVLLQLTGGNDGLSTIIPHGDDAYHASRKRIRHKASEVLKIDDYRGFHPVLGGLRNIWEAGHLGIIEGVGYPNALRSHFKSFDIWHTASYAGRAEGEGWISKLCRAAWKNVDLPELTVHVGGVEIPYSLESVDFPAIGFALPERYQWIGSDRDARALRDVAEESDRDSEKEGQAGVLERLRSRQIVWDIGSADPTANFQNILPRRRRGDRSFRLWLSTIRASFPSTVLRRLRQWRNAESWSGYRRKLRWLLSKSGYSA